MLLLLLLIAATSTQASCGGKISCHECVADRGWLGGCRWCDLDASCRQAGSLLNPCSSSQNLVRVEQCPALQPTKTPVVLMPGVGGTRLEQRNSQNGRCTWDSWTNVWFSLSKTVTSWDCLAENLSMKFRDGKWEDSDVETRPVNGLAGISYLDPSNGITRKASLYFGEIAQKLQGLHGYRENVNLLPAGYDWRKNVHEAIDHIELTAKIEEMVQRTKKRAVFVTHSYGCLIGYNFLVKKSKAWKDQNVAEWIAVSCPFGGALGSLKAVLSGYNFGLSPILSDKEGLKLVPNVASVFELLPNDAFFANNKDLIRFSDRIYGSSDWIELLEFVGLSQQAQARTFRGPLADPGVAVSLVTSTGEKTPKSYEYLRTFFRSVWDDLRQAPQRTVFTDEGDGTVAYASMTWPLKLGWERVQHSNFKGGHRAILADDVVLDHIMGRFVNNKN